MCSEVTLRDGSIVDTIGHLRRVLGVPIVYHEGYAPPLSDESCLCPVDVEAMAKQYDPPLRCEFDGIDYKLDFDPRTKSAS